MLVRSIMSGAPVLAPPTTSVATTARLLNDSGVGAVVIVDNHRVVGIVTDRDIVTRAVASRRSLDEHVDTVMTPRVVTVRDSAPVEEAYERLRRSSFRRLPVVNDDDVLVGMLSIDDLFLDLCRRVSDLAGPIAEEMLDPQRETVAADG